MAVTGKTGADAIFIALRHICHVIVSYQSRLNAVIDAAVTGGAITNEQGIEIKAFVTTAGSICSAFEALALFSGF